MTEHYDFVIIGNSAAGLQALKTLRRHDRYSTIAVIDREDCPAYSRVLTPYYIGGHIGREGLDIVTHSFYKSLGITTIFGHAVVAVKADKHRLKLADGKELSYTKLLLATGAEARIISTASQRSCVLRHIADADKLISLQSGVSSITAIGAGLVSLPLLSHADNKIEKHLIVGSNRIFSRVVDADAAVILEEKLSDQGLKIHKQDDIATLTEGERLGLTLTSGKSFASDLLIIGKGVSPNAGLASAAGLKVATGVIIDAFCATDHPDIFAAGDSAEGFDFISAERTVQGNWMTAVEQGENAALNMLGFKAPYQGSLKNNITEIFGIDVAAVGYCHDDADHIIDSYNPVTGRYRKVFLDHHQRVIGATMIGETNDSGLYYHLITTREVFPGTQLLKGTANYAQVQLRLAS